MFLVAFQASMDHRTPSGLRDDAFSRSTKPVSADRSQAGELRGLTCWRKSSVTDEMKHYQFLSTGCGYSSTAFMAKAMTDAGYPVGHESLLEYGTSAWPAAGRRHAWSPLHFKHIFVVVRHPLKVLRSYNSTRWNFRFPGVELRDEVSVQPHEAFNAMQWEFKALEWWNSYTSLAENVAECAYRIEDMSSSLLSSICARAELPKCEEKPWDDIMDKYFHYNVHNKYKALKLASWKHLESVASTADERMVLGHARVLCRRVPYDDCLF